MNHLIQTTSLSKIRQERCLLNMLVLLQRMVFTSDIFGFANLLSRNYQLTILCRENLRYHRDTSILSKREMILWCLNPIFLRKNIIVLILLLIFIVITMIRLLFPIVMLTPRRRIVYGVLDGSPRRNNSARNSNVASTSTSALSQS